MSFMIGLIRDEDCCGRDWICGVGRRGLFGGDRE
jgi:hypothetical protein